jgi:hypothetical protein
VCLGPEEVFRGGAGRDDRFSSAAGVPSWSAETSASEPKRVWTFHWRFAGTLALMAAVDRRADAGLPAPVLAFASALICRRALAVSVGARRRLSGRLHDWGIPQHFSSELAGGA